MLRLGCRRRVLPRDGTDAPDHARPEHGCALLHGDDFRVRCRVAAAISLPKMFPMLMTAAGTVTAAKVFVLGAGVAGLQAIATARRLGAVVRAYDVRQAVKEQVESVGAKFVGLNLEAGASEGNGGYAKEMDEKFY